MTPEQFESNRRDVLGLLLGRLRHERVVVVEITLEPLPPAPVEEVIDLREGRDGVWD